MNQYKSDQLQIWALVENQEQHSVGSYTMDEKLRCIACQKTGPMAVMREKGLNTFKECSVIRKNNFTARIKTNGPNMNHEKCRSSYTNIKI